MDDKNRVLVTSHQKGELTIKYPDRHFIRTFANAGASHKIEVDILEEMIMNEPGVQYMFKQGLLSIADAADRVAVGLQDELHEDAPVIFDRNFMTKMIKGMPFVEFKTNFDKGTMEQKRLIAETAVELRINDLEKATYIKNKTGIDVLKRIAIEVDKATPAEPAK